MRARWRFFSQAILVGTCLVATVWGAGGLPSVAAPSTGGVIYVIGYQQDNPFWVTEGAGAAQAGKDQGVTVRYEAPPQPTDTGMISLIQAAMAAHPYGVCIDYTGKAMEAVTLRALQKGIKVVLYNNNRFEAESGGATTNPLITNLAYVGQDEHHSGEILANAFLPYLPSSGTVLIINPFPEAFVLTLRYQGVKRVLEAHGYKTALLLASGDENRNEAITGAYLRAHSEVVGVVGLGNPGATPATRYIEQHHLKIPVATFDINTTTYNMMKAGGQEKVALDQQPFLQSYYCAQNLAMEMRFGFQPVNVNTGTFVVTKQNIAILDRLVAAGKD
jgi:ABC-type sugar transport system substrate-binding protein